MACISFHLCSIGAHAISGIPVIVCIINNGGIINDGHITRSVDIIIIDIPVVNMLAGYKHPVIGRNTATAYGYINVHAGA
jgi:hypothetical protein